MQRHQAVKVSGVVDISDAHQFNNGVMGADRRFSVVVPRLGHPLGVHVFDTLTPVLLRARHHPRRPTRNSSGVVAYISLMVFS